MKAVWRDQIIAESEDTLLLEGNHYFPPELVDKNFITFSNHKSNCPWKGIANYYSLIVKGEMLTDAAWFYAEPKEGATHIKNYVAFWKEVKVTQ